MTAVRKLTRGGAIALMMMAIATALAIWASPALAAGTPGAVPDLVSTTHPDPAAWYPAVTASFVWNAATETGGGTIAGYSFTFDQSANTVPPVLSGAALSYLARVNYTVGSSPAEDRVADLNGDGKLDLVAENSGSNTVSVLLGNGDGTFRSAVSYATGTNPWSLQVGDVNGDGKLDIVSCNEAASTISVLLGNGDGTFRAAVDYTTGAGTSPECMRLGDLSGDGKPDVITANAGTDNISVLRNNGNGTFAAPVTYSTATHPTSIAIGDLNGDGKQDVVTANYATNNVSVLIGNGDTTFKTAVNYACGATPQTVELADCNGDSKLDIVTANYNSTASVLINNGSGTFATNVEYATGAGPYSLSLADLNHDGYVDIVTVNHSANNVSVLLGNGDGTFAAHADYATGNGPFWVALGDFNGDGYGDIAATNESDGTVSVLLGSGYYRSASGKLGATFNGVSDGTWYLHVRAIDNKGVAGPTSTCQINVDTVAPTTSASGLQASDSTGWTNSQTVTLTASDALSHVSATYYTVDGVQHTYGAPFQVSGAGSHTITYWSVDNAGNAETHHTGYVNLDLASPVTTAATNPSGWTNGQVQVTLSGSDQGGSGLAATFYQIGSGQTHTYSGPFSVSDASAVTYWSTDQAGNVEGGNTLTPQIDTVAPVTTATTDPSGWTNGAVTVTLSASDQGGSAVASTSYRIGNGAAQAYTEPFTVSDATTVTYWSTDNAGNVEADNTLTPQIDTVAPVTTATTDPSGWTNGSVQVTLSATDQGGSDVASTSYRIGNGAVQTYDEPFTVSDATTVTYWSTDNAGNVEAGNTLTPQIDTVAPVTSSADLSTAAGTAWQPGPVDVTLAASDADSGVAATSYQVDDQGMQPYKGTFTVAGEGSHRVDFFSVDKAGNVETTESGWVDIDSLGPTSGAIGLSAQGAGWTTRPQTVTLQATDAGSGTTGGVAAICYSVDGIAQPDYTAPFVVAGEGPHVVSYYAVDAAGNVGDTHLGYVNIDTTAPATTADGLVAGPDTGWVHDAQQVTLTAHDDGCGDTTTWYTLDGSDPIQYGGAFTVAGVQSHEITYWSVDCLGNREDTQTGYVNIAPDQALITLASGLAGTDHTGWRNSAATITLTPSGGGGTIVTQYRVDQGQWQTYTAPFSVSGDGSHQVDYRSSDDVNDHPLPSTGFVNIDTTPPVTTATAPATPQRTDAIVLLTPGDAQSGVNATFYRIDNGAWTPYVSSVRVAAPATHKNDGLHTVSYYSIDNAGNGDSSLARQVTVRIDTTRPAFTLRSAKRVTVHRGRSLSLRLRARDAGGTCKLVVTLSRKVGKRVVKYTSTLSTRHVGSWQTVKLRLTRPRGTYTAVLRLCDPAGNLSAAKTIRVTIK